MYENSSCSKSSSMLIMVSLLIFSHSNRCVVVFHCVLICIDLMTNDVEHLFIWSLAIHISYIFFGEVSVQIFSPFWERLFVFLLLSFVGSLCILDISNQIYDLQIFSSSLWFVFSFS